MMFHRNCILVSSDGSCITQLSGGDFDGDLVMISFNQKLNKVLAKTGRVHESLAPDSAFARAKSRSNNKNSHEINKYRKRERNSKSTEAQPMSARWVTTML